MNCEQVKDLLSPYLDNVLATDDHRTIATHLEICPDCNSTIADFRRFDTLLSRLPRVNPDSSLRDRIFTSPDYLELIGTSHTASKPAKETRPYKSVRTDIAQRPQLVALPGGRQDQRFFSSSEAAHPFASPERIDVDKFRQRRWGTRVLRVALVATVLLVLGVGGLITWTLWQRQTQLAHTTTGSFIMPPAGLQQGPIPAGVRFLFLRNGALWSTPTDGGNTGILRLTPQNTTVAPQWVVRPAQTGHSAGNVVAYIDLQQGFVHLVRSDGQNDAPIQQPLLKAGVQPSTVWNTATGTAILSGLSWSNDGTMLAFVADPAGTAQTGLYIYNINTNKLQTVALPIAGAVSHLSWSPDNIRIGFTITHNGISAVLDYNTQNQGVLIIQNGATVLAGDTVLSLQWSSNVNVPALTWSIGQTGNVHTIWMHRVGVGGQPTLLANGAYTQANYSQVGHNGIGVWLLVVNNAGVSGDILSVDLSASVSRLTVGRQVSHAQWSPDGNAVAYITTLSNGMRTLHVLNTLTEIDTLMASDVVAEPLPVWSTDSLRLAYSTGTHVQVVSAHPPAVVQTLKPQGQIVAIKWSTTSPTQLVLSTGANQPGIYLIDTQNGATHQLDKETPQGSILWTQIP